jgi:hypothetical protein
MVILIGESHHDGNDNAMGTFDVGISGSDMIIFSSVDLDSTALSDHVSNTSSTHHSCGSDAIIFVWGVSYEDYVFTGLPTIGARAISLSSPAHTSSLTYWQVDMATQRDAGLNQKILNACVLLDGCD